MKIYVSFAVEIPDSEHPFRSFRSIQNVLKLALRAINLEGGGILQFGPTDPRTTPGTKQRQLERLIREQARGPRRKNRLLREAATFFQAHPKETRPWRVAIDNWLANFEKCDLGNPTLD